MKPIRTYETQIDGQKVVVKVYASTKKERQHQLTSPRYQKPSIGGNWIHKKREE